MTSAKRPLYFRLLRVRHLTVRPWVTFLLFEGSIAVGALLAFAEIVSPWATVAVPVAVAAMVKLNDLVARAAVEPLAVAQLRTPRLLAPAVVGRSAVAGTGRVTTRIASRESPGDATTGTGLDGAAPADGWAGLADPDRDRDAATDPVQGGGTAAAEGGAADRPSAAEGHAGRRSAAEPGDPGTAHDGEAPGIGLEGDPAAPTSNAPESTDQGGRRTPTQRRAAPSQPEGPPTQPDSTAMDDGTDSGKALGTPPGGGPAGGSTGSRSGRASRSSRGNQGRFDD